MDQTIKLKNKEIYKNLSHKDFYVESNLWTDWKDKLIGNIN